jgi:hypothetical protein
MFTPKIVIAVFAEMLVGLQSAEWLKPESRYCMKALDEICRGNNLGMIIHE